MGGVQAPACFRIGALDFAARGEGPRQGAKGLSELLLSWFCLGQGLRISEDHRPNRADEKRRIEKAGGLVVRDANRVWRVGSAPLSKLF